MGATNRPFDLDEAALRRMTKRVYIGLPETDEREALIKMKIAAVSNDLSGRNLTEIAEMTRGYSSADLTAVVKDAAMGPLREVPPADIITMDKDSLRPVNKQDFVKAIRCMAPSVSQATVQQYHDWH